MLMAADGQKALDLLEVRRGCCNAVWLAWLTSMLCFCWCWGADLQQLPNPCTCNVVLLHACMHSVATAAHALLPAPTLHGPVMRAKTEHLSLNQRRVRQPRPMRPCLHVPAVASSAHA